MFLIMNVCAFIGFWQLGMNVLNCSKKNSCLEICDHFKIQWSSILYTNIHNWFHCYRLGNNITQKIEQSLWKQLLTFEWHKFMNSWSCNYTTRLESGYKYRLQIRSFLCSLLFHNFPCLLILAYKPLRKQSDSNHQVRPDALAHSRA